MSTLRVWLMRLVLLLIVADVGWAAWQNPPAWLVAAIKRATDKPPAWPDNYAAGAAQAQAEHKPIFLHFTGSDWCYYCQQQDKYILDTPEFRDYAAKNLVFVEVDMPQHKSQPAALKEQNLQLSMKYDVHGLPTVILLSSDGNTVLLRAEGFDEDNGPKSFIAQLNAMVKKNG